MSTFAVSAAGGPAPSPKFYTTQNSDEWVDHTFTLQKAYTRVLLVTSQPGATASQSGAAASQPGPQAPEKVEAAIPDFNHPGAAKPASWKVDKVFKTLQEAADAAHGGDLVAVAPGTYAGFVIEGKKSCGDGAYIHFKALGKPGEVTINDLAMEDGKPLSNHMILLFGAHHVILQGFNIAGQTGPGMDPKGSTSGIMVGSNFIETRTMTHHIALIENYSHNHNKWGMHSTDSHTVLMQDNCFAFSRDEHSAYVSDGSDNYVIRRNVFYGSSGCGLQCNIDPDTCLRKMSNMPEFADLGRVRGNRQWAEAMLKAATEKFGKCNFPDGLGENFIIENNVVNANGDGRGGGAFNLAGVIDSLIQNNLVYGNFNHGLVFWDSGNSFDRAMAKPGPTSAAAVTGPESLPLFGSRNNLARNNTILMNNKDRYALGAINGSYGCKLRNNVAINDGDNSLEFSSTSMLKLDSGYNVCRNVAYLAFSMHSTAPWSTPTSMPADMSSLATKLDENNHTVIGITLPAFAKEVVKYNNNPWVLFEGNWWRLNPDRPDFHPKAGSSLLCGKADPAELPPADLDGQKRPAADIGCYRAAK